jgi:hypothetical protein
MAANTFALILALVGGAVSATGAAGDSAASPIRTIAGETAGIEAAWEQALRQLPGLARARRLPTPEVLDMVLSQGPSQRGGVELHALRRTRR